MYDIMSTCALLLYYFFIYSVSRIHAAENPLLYWYPRNKKHEGCSAYVNHNELYARATAGRFGDGYADWAVCFEVVAKQEIAQREMFYGPDDPLSRYPMSDMATEKREGPLRVRTPTSRQTGERFSSGTAEARSTHRKPISPILGCLYFRHQ